MLTTMGTVGAVVDVAGPDMVTSGPVVTAAEVVAGHVSLDVCCLDRLYLTGFVAKRQTPGGVVYFLHDHRGNPIPSPAVFEQIGNKFRAAIRAWAPDQPNAPPRLRHALDTIDRIVTQRITHPRVPT